MLWEVVPSGRRGRQQTHRGAAITSLPELLNQTRQTKSTAASRLTAHTIPANATMQLQPGMPMLSSTRKNAKLWKPNTPGARARNEAVRSSKYLGRALWRQVTGYHRKSRVETKPLGIMLRITLPVTGCTASNCGFSA
jgi:hypothetical protein